MEIWLSIALGLGLAAACGFRIFVPLLVMSIAARTDHLDLAGGFSWIESTPALVAFGSATALELAAYSVPWLDNLLDTLATPTAVVAGVMATGSQVADLDPWLSWTVSVIGGGGAAGGVQALTVVTRQVSAFATGGFGNPLVAAGEAGAALGLTVLAIILPLVAVFALLVAVFMLLSLIARRRRTAAPA